MSSNIPFLIWWWICAIANTFFLLNLLRILFFRILFLNINRNANLFFLLIFNLVSFGLLCHQMQPLKHCLIESTLNRIISDGSSLFSFDLEHIFYNVIEEKDRFLLLFKPFFIVLFVRKPWKDIKEKLNIILFGHINRTENRETWKTLQFIQILIPYFTLFNILPISHTSHHHFNHFLQPFEFLKMLKDSLLGDKLRLIRLIWLIGHFLYRWSFEYIMSFNLEL